MNTIRRTAYRIGLNLAQWFLARNGLAAVREDSLYRANAAGNAWYRAQGSKGTRSGETRRAGFRAIRALLALTAEDLGR
jgi:hypothetical protein